jgi:hypothetical protein
VQEQDNLPGCFIALLVS